MTDDQQRARELLADYLQQDGYFIAQQIREGNLPTYEQTIIKAITSALRAAPEWQPIDTAPENKLVMVGWMDDEGVDRQEFDYIEDGLWIHHADLVEHAQMVAPPGSQMPREQPPYQWWMDLPAFPAARPQGVKDRPGIDGCTESNCKRCRTHPDHRGGMEHAGIGWRPDSPQEASDG